MYSLPFSRKILIFFSLLLFPSFTWAQNSEQSAQSLDENFTARIIDVVDIKKTINADGTTSIDKEINLVGLEGSLEGKKFTININETEDDPTNIEYKADEKVIINLSKAADGSDNFYIVGYSRTSSLFWMTLLFVASVIAIGKWKGLRALIVLGLTAIIILKFIIPLILSGHNPLLISIIGSFFILLLAILITEGFKRSSWIAVLSVLSSLIITGLLSIWFTSMAKLTGFASEESSFLISLFGSDINIKGLLLAGIIIGSLGVLDDVIVSQVSVVKALKKANPQLSSKELYQKGMQVGISHLGSMVNTLFLAYAGAALPLMILFSLHEPPFSTFEQIINHEVITTEIVRTLAGSIGLVLSVPIATLLAARLEKGK